MAYTGNGDSMRATFKCGASLATTTSQYKACYLSAANTVSLCTAAADKVIGIVDSYQDSNSTVVSVITGGIARGWNLANTAAASGDWLAPGAGGVLVPYITNTTAQILIGYAIDAGATGGAMTVYVAPQVHGVKS